MEEGISLGEIQRSLARIEKSLETVVHSVGEHDTAIELLKQSRSDAIWVINLIWAAIVGGLEWLLHGRTH